MEAKLRWLPVMIVSDLRYIISVVRSKWSYTIPIYIYVLICENEEENNQKVKWLWSINGHWILYAIAPTLKYSFVQWI